MLHISKIITLSIFLLFYAPHLNAQQAWNQSFVCDTMNSITDFVPIVHANIGQMTMEFWIKISKFKATKKSYIDDI